MAIIKKWDGIGVANGTVTTSTAGSGDTVFSQVSLSPTVSNGAIVIPNVSGITYVRWNDLTLSAWSVRFYMTLNGAVAGPTSFLHAWSTANSRMWVLSLLSSRQVILSNSSNTAVGNGPILTLGADYRFEIRGQSGTDSVVFKVFDASETEIFTKTTAIGTTLGLQHLQFGRQSTTQFGPASYSHFRVDNTNTTIGAYVSPGTTFTEWMVHDGNGVQVPLTLNGMWNGTSIVALDSAMLHEGVTEPPPYRTVFDWPFRINAMSNTSLGSGATFESSTDVATNRFLTATYGRGFNHTDWSIQAAKTTTSDPLCLVTNPSSGVVYNGGNKIYVPAALGTAAMPIPGPAAASNADKAVVILQPDGITSYDCYRMTKNGADWTATNFKTSNWKTGDGLDQGIRASGINAGVGLIRAAEILAGEIPHVMVMSLPKEMLKQTPIASDGELRSSGGKAVAVWPARLQDNQANVLYNSVANGGVIAMGSLFAIPPTTPMPTGLSPEGVTLFHALQDYGVMVADQSGAVVMYVEQDLLNGDTSDAAVNRMRGDFGGDYSSQGVNSTASTALFLLLRRVTNNTSTNVGGGGTRRRPEAPAFEP